MRKNIIITGPPHSGKSTLLKSVISSLPNRIGFVTNEIKPGDERFGFEIEMMNGSKAILAYKGDNIGKYRVSKYNVSISELGIFSDELINKSKEGKILYLDEIGEMQLFSEEFKKLVINYLDSPQTTIMTLTSVFASDFIEKIKNRDDVIIVQLDEQDRDSQKAFVETLLRKIEKARNYASDPELWVRIAHERSAILNSEHGQRLIYLSGEYIGCDCGFYSQNKICSHFIAAEEIFKN